MPILLLFFAIASQLVAQSTLSFFEEHIDFSIDSNYFYINGIYSFKTSLNEADNQCIGFPFASHTDSIDLIKIIDLNVLRKVPFTIQKKAITFQIMVLPHDTLDLNIQYRQKRSAKNSYIITSTQSWEKPLVKAFYTFTAPVLLPIKSFSYLPDSMRMIYDKKVYYWYKSNFMPETEFNVILND